MRTPLAAPADVDARAFAYPLAALAQKLGWELDAKTTELARAASRLHEVQGREQALEENIGASVRHIAALVRAGLNPATHRTHLQYLVQLKSQLHEAQAELVIAQREHHALRAQCTELHTRMEGLSRHRDDAHAAFVQDVRRQQSSERDRDWLARSFPTSTPAEGEIA